MKRILMVNACVRPHSRTMQLARHVLGLLEGDVEELRLYDEGIPPLDMRAMEERDRLCRESDLSLPCFRYAEQFAKADCILIAAPYWDLLFPAVLRTYLEAVTVSGITFRYTSHGIPTGLCRAKYLFYVTTGGGPIGEINMGFDYVAALAERFYGIPNIYCISAEGLDMEGADVDGIMDEAKARASAELGGINF